MTLLQRDEQGIGAPSLKPAEVRSPRSAGFKNTTRAGARFAPVSCVAVRGKRVGEDYRRSGSNQAGPIGPRPAKCKRPPTCHAAARLDGRQRIAKHAGRTRRITSTALTLEAALELIEAADEACRIGLPLNRFVTINWEKGGANDGSHATSVFLRKIGDWCRRHDCATAYIWVRENGRWNGQHAHVLIHIPPALAKDFARRQRAWLAQCGLGWGKGMVKGKPVGASRSRSVGSAGAVATYRTGLMHAVDYLLKEIDPAACEQLGVTMSPKRTGLPVTYKRSGVSTNITRATRTKSGHVASASRVEHLGRLSGW